MMKKKTGWVLIIALIVAAVAAGVYYGLGGFRSRWVEEVQYRSRVVWGTPYQGQYGDMKLREIFVKTQNLLTEDTAAGTLVVVNYDSLFDTNEVNQLIGLLAENPSGPVRPDQTADTLAPGTYLRIHLYGQPAVRPSPARVHQNARRYAQENGLFLGKKVIEQYFGPDSMWIEYPLHSR